MSSRATSDQSILPLQSWPGRSCVAIFVRCLHLLDLDLLEDWPAVTEQLLAAKTAQQNLQQRIKAVEWSLFRLFEIYDPQETKDKLRPFFPPTTQLQSLNLRAALYRCLTDLKKNGVLAKDVVLRKTMFDDCKGERFEEVIASLAVNTLKKAARLGGDVTQDNSARPESLAMHLAYRVSLHNNLLARKESHLEGKRLLEHLAILQDCLQERLENSRAGRMKTDLAKQRELRALINNNWIGNSEWTDILLHGALGTRMLDTGNHELASLNTNESQKLLQGLEDQTQRHQSRLSQWNTVAREYASKQKQERSPPKPESTFTGRAETSLRFHEHKSLNLSECNSDSIRQQPIDDSYQRLLSTLRREFSETATALKKQGLDPATTIPASVTSTAERDPSLLLEDFDRRAETQQAAAEPSHVDADAAAATPDGDTGSVEQDSSERSDSPSPICSTDGDSLWIPSRPGGTIMVEEGNCTPIQIFSPPVFNAQEDPVSPSSMWMSLADRTRASMSFTGRQSILNDPDSPIDQETAQPVEAAWPGLHPPSDDDRHSTLVERTRKSMSLFSGSASRLKKTRAEKRTSQNYPVNQFETPGRPHRQSDWKPESGSSTPREHLFEEEAEYASVFKSRPKLALSPAFSPDRRSSRLDNILEKDMERLNLDSDVD